ncbi:MAG: class I SAM-dependent methyltransferase [Deltaproteobacteria bacterium]|nr:class I SAM-dependent methyltransferase [Deltaproteobacteria bacterium]
MPSTMPHPPDGADEACAPDSYIIRGGVTGSDRLSILAHATWPTSKPFLIRAGLRPGMHCLDLGCGNGAISLRLFEILGPTGTVFGLDRDATNIAIAQQQATQLAVGARAEFSAADVMPGIETMSRQFDLIYLRLLLSHLTAPATLLQRLRKHLKPGGTIAIEDVDFDGHRCAPACPAFARYVALYKTVARQRGADATIGPKLEGMVRAAGYHDIEVSSVTPVFTTGEGKQMATLTLAAIAESAINSRLATRADIDEIRGALAAFAQDPTTQFSLPTFYQLRCGVNV